MSEKEVLGTVETTQEVLSTLTPRERKVLLKRFGIEFGESNEDEPENPASFMPPSSGGGGHGGAPQSAISSPPVLPDEREKPSKALTVLETDS